MALASANSLGNGIFNPEYWAKRMQQIFFRDNVAIELANTELRDVLVDGDVIHKPYRSHLKAQAYVKGTAVTLNAVSGLDSYLTVDTIRVAPFYIDDVDTIQNKWNMLETFSADAIRVLNNELDQAVLAEHSNANSSVYAADVGGSGASTNLVLTTSNVFNVFTAASRKLDSLNMPQSPRFAVLGTRALETLRLSLAGRETGFGEQVGANGKVGTRFGFDIYYSNNCPFSATWTPANQPSAGDTVTINGVAFTFRTDTCDAAGEVYSTTGVAETLANLVLAINGTTAGTATTYYEVSDANRWKLSSAGIAATEDDTALSLTGYGDIVVAASESNDPWSAETNHLLFGVKGATDLVVQSSPKMEFQRADLMIGTNALPWMLYGKKTFEDMKDALVDVNVDASAWA